ncbi:hypothetical protein BKK54_03225 [Rodentibacter genomosp. 1]|uniref:HTH cro/C1-type domain-containing protein n=1 Tax=Rodentibacter genomosp. 1 TaxID=1908264 RepID=A0A1V3J7T8_9PAST|nr:S24 family peptidase [Rodentibacter genomosp. 1]OOF51436.1 hypothetical protein BKK54_03225 [Rodentibacter genomosp. 1]
MREKWNEIVRRRIKEINIPRPVFAERVGISSPALGHWLNGTRKPNLEDIARMFYLLGIDSVTLHSDGLVSLQEVHEVSQIEGVALIGSLDFGFKEMGNATEQTQFVAEEKRLYVDFRSSDPRPYALKIKGTALIPRIRRDEIIVVEPMLKQPSVGDDVVLIVKATGEYLIKNINTLAVNAEDPHIFADINDRTLLCAFKKCEVDIHPITGIVGQDKIVR